MKKLFFIGLIILYCSNVYSFEKPLIQYKISEPEYDEYKQCISGCVNKFKMIPNSNLAILYIPDLMIAHNNLYNFELWNIETGEVLKKFYIPNAPNEWSDIYSVYISSDSKKLLVGGTGILTVVDIGSGKVIRKFKTEFWSRAGGFSPDNNLILTEDDENIFLYDIFSGREICKVDGTQVESSGFTGKDNNFFSYKSTSHLNIFDGGNCEIINKIDIININAYAFSFSNDKHIILSSLDKIMVLNIKTNIVDMVLKTYEIEGYLNWGLQIINNQYVFLVCEDGQLDSVCIFDIKDGDLIHKIDAGEEIRRFQIMNNDKLVTIGYKSQNLRIWNLPL